MTIQTVSTSNTFNEWRVVTNSLVTEVNKTELGTAQLYVDTVTANTITSNGDITVNGGDLNTTSSTFNFANTTATTVNIGGDATTVRIGAASGTTTVRNDLSVSGNTAITGTLNVTGGITLSGSANVVNDLNVTGDIDIDGGDLTFSTTTANLVNATATTVNFAGAATTLEIGAATGNTNINNNLIVDGNATVSSLTTNNGVVFATNSGKLNTNSNIVWTGTVLDVNGNVSARYFDAVNGVNLNYATTNAIGFVNGSGALVSNTNLSWNGTTLGVTGNQTVSGTLGVTGNVTLSGELRGPSTFTIDPAVVGDDTGTVVIKGNLQVDGTTTTINSTTLTVDDINIVLASGAANAAAANGAGITIDGASATITYISSGDKFVVNKALEASNTLTVTGATTLSSTLGVTGVATFSADSRFTSTGAVLISKGTSGQQPGTPEVGMLRYNTTTGEFEGYSGASPSWKSVGGSAITNDTSTASDLYPAFLADTANTALNIYTSNSKLLYKPSTGELKAEQFVAQNGLFVNSTIIDANYTIGANTNAFSVGPITVANGSAVTVSSGQRWVVI